MFKCPTLLNLNRELWDLNEVSTWSINMQQHGKTSAEEAMDSEANIDVVDKAVDRREGDLTKRKMQYEADRRKLYSDIAESQIVVKVW